MILWLFLCAFKLMNMAFQIHQIYLVLLMTLHKLDITHGIKFYNIFFLRNLIENPSSIPEYNFL